MTVDHLSVEARIRGISDRLASPDDAHSRMPHGWWPQSLARGAAGVALLHIERARAGQGPWQRAHDWLACAAHGGVAAGEGTHLHQGAPALAFALHCAADRPGRYDRALDTLDRHITAATRARIDRAHARIDRGALPALAEFDAIRGLAGIGAYLLRRDPNAEAVRAVLGYVVRLTEPVTQDGEVLPGWWTGLDPAGLPSTRFPGGHGNNGMAHGVAGPLALLSLAVRRGVAVPGHGDAVDRICRWLDRWRQDGPAGPWWPYWVTRRDLHAGRVTTPRRGRPSWCYGTAGLARAQQLAALATGDAARQRAAEHALLAALTDPTQLAATTDPSLCHGHAGLMHVARRAAADAASPQLAARMPGLLDAVVGEAGGVLSVPARPPSGDVGLLEGAAGVAVALNAAQVAPVSGWDSCLLIT